MTGYPAFYSDLYDPAFPESPLGTAVELYTGAWADITDYVYQRDPISITRGRPDESSQANPSQCTMTLNNRDNRFTINNPSGPYSGLLNRNAPLRASVPNSILGGSTYLRLEDDAVSYASCPAAPRIELTGSFDVRIDVSIHGYGPLILAGIWSAAATVNQRSWALILSPAGHVGIYLSPDGTLASVVVSDQRAPLPLGRLVIRATVNVSTGVVTFYYGPAGQIDGSTWTQLGTTTVGIGGVPGAIFASTSAPLTVGYSPGLEWDAQQNVPASLLSLFENSWIGTTGAVYDFELRNGIGGTVVAKAAFSSQNAGAASWTDTAGNSWTVSGTANLNNRSYRYHGELTTTPKAADPSGRDIYSQATASGVLRRLQQANTPLNSPMYRAMTKPGTSVAFQAPPVAYWPCEDQAGSTLLASGLPSGQPMQISGAPQLADSSAFPGSDALPVLNGSIWRAPVPQGATWTRNLFGLLLQIPSAGEANGAVIASIYTHGTAARIDLVYASAAGGSLSVNCYNTTGTLIMSVSGFTYTSGPVNGASALVEISIYVFGGSLVCSIGTAVPYANPLSTISAGIAGTVGAVSSVAINPNGTLVNSVVGHVFVSPGTDNGTTMLTTPVSGPLGGWLGETAGERFQRLCTEEGIAARVVGHPSLTTPMGVQAIDTLVNLLEMCETTDRGMLMEPRSCLGVGYRTPLSMYNQAPGASVSYTAAQLDQAFASTCDDLLTVNDVTVSNTDGSSARQVLSAGPLSVNAPPNGVGRVDGEIQVNAATDGQLPGIAQWTLHVSTDAHDRFPVIPFNLARSETGFAVASLDIGALLAITNPPQWLQPDEIDQLCAGFTETFGPFPLWQIDVNGIPAYPYTIAQVAGAGGNAVHADTDGSQITSTVSATAVTLSVATTSPYPIWTTNAADFPFDIRVAGERMTVTNITGSSSPQTFTVTRSVNGVAKTQTAGAALALWYTPICGQLTGS